MKHISVTDKYSAMDVRYCQEGVGTITTEVFIFSGNLEKYGLNIRLYGPDQKTTVFEGTLEELLRIVAPLIAPEAGEEDQCVQKSQDT